MSYDYNKPFGDSFEHRLADMVKHETLKAKLNVAMHISKLLNNFKQKYA